MKNATVEQYYRELDSRSRAFVDQSIQAICAAKLVGRKVMAVTGSGPNIHEGVTTLIAQLVNKGIIDAVTTSSAVVAHELGGVLDRVKRIKWEELSECEGLIQKLLPRGNLFEYTVLQKNQLDRLRAEMNLDESLLSLLQYAKGTTIIKAAGNMAYPVGLRTELLADEILRLSQACLQPFEYIAGAAADPRTMLGACRAADKPILVSVPQLVGGGAVGIGIAESIPVSNRCMRIAQMIESCDVIIESAVALTQEIHDGPFETYTGHGVWAAWRGYPTYSLKEKTIIRIDLDANLYRAWEMEREGQVFQKAIDQSLPKTKISNIPFRMEMSAFTRHEKSIPILNDIGVVWPVIAYFVANHLGIELDFMSYPQQSEQGQQMRAYIADNILFADRSRLYGGENPYPCRRRR